MRSINVMREEDKVKESKEKDFNVVTLMCGVCSPFPAHSRMVMGGVEGA